MPRAVNPAVLLCAGQEHSGTLENTRSCAVQGFPATAQQPSQAHHQHPGAQPPAPAGAQATAQQNVQGRPPSKTGTPQGAAGSEKDEEVPVSVPPVLAAIWEQSPGYAGEVQALREIEELKQAAKKLALAAAAQQQQHELSAC